MTRSIFAHRVAGLLLVAVGFGLAAGGTAADQKDDLKKVQAFEATLTAALGGIAKQQEEAIATKSEPELRSWIEARGSLCDVTDPCADACVAREQANATKMTLLCSLQRIRTTVERELETRGKLGGSISFGMHADRTKREEAFLDSAGSPVDGKDRTQIMTHIALRGGSYPNSLRATWGAQVRLEDGELEDDVTALRINFDHYFADWLEAYAFLERFTDSFLGIDQRWEGGLGIDLEYKLRGIDKVCKGKELSRVKCRNLTPEGARTLVEWQKLVALGALTTKDGRLEVDGDRLWELLDIVEDRKQRTALIEAIRKLVELGESKWVRRALRNETSRLELSLSLSWLRESERFEFATRAVDAMTGIPTGADSVVANGARSLNRLSIRPGIRLRPTDTIELRAMVFFKPSLSSDDPPGIDDYRIDGTFYTEFKFDPTLFGAEPRIRFQYDYRFDNSPPSLDDSSLNPLPALAMGQSYAPRTADETRHYYGLSFGLTW